MTLIGEMVHAGGTLGRMDDKAFQGLADEALKQIVAKLDSIEELGLDDLPDTVRIEFPDRRKLIVNRHTAARQIWLAAPSGAWHFAPQVGTSQGEAARWIDVRTGVELYGQLEALIESMLGRRVSLA